MCAIPGIRTSCPRTPSESGRRHRPSGYGFEFGGISREEAQTGNNVAIIFAVCILLVYLILSGMYESLVLPFTVLLFIVPALWMVFQGIQEKIKPVEFVEADDAIAAEKDKVARLKLKKESESKNEN